MTSHSPVVLEHESIGTASAYVVGLPSVFAAADSERTAASAIREALRAHLAALHTLPVAVCRVRTTTKNSGCVKRVEELIGVVRPQ